jgi:hypothetical protein
MLIIRSKTPTSPYSNFCRIPLGKGRFAYVSPQDFPYLNRFRWSIKMSHSLPYAVRRVRSGGRERYIRMHREIMQTPPELHCHHINHDTLDNRRSNLVNLEPSLHLISHKTGEFLGDPLRKEKIRRPSSQMHI